MHKCMNNLFICRTIEFYCYVYLYESNLINAGMMQKCLNTAEGKHKYFFNCLGLLIADWQQFRFAAHIVLGGHTGYNIIISMRRWTGE